MMGIFFFLKEHCWFLQDEIYCSLTTYWKRGFVAFQAAINAAIIEVSARFQPFILFIPLFRSLPHPPPCPTLLRDNTLPLLREIRKRQVGISPYSTTQFL